MNKGWQIQKPSANIRLNIGSGDPSIVDKQYPGINCLNQDIAEFDGLDLLCDIRELKRYIDDGECSYIMAVHVLEHFGVSEIDQIFTMLYNLLEVGGELDVIVPNFSWHGLLLGEGKDYEALLYCFGEQRDQWDFHKTAFTQRILKDRMEKAGFKEVTITDGTSILGIGKKL